MQQPLDVSEVREFVYAYMRRQLARLEAHDVHLEDDLNFIDAGILTSMGFLELLAAAEEQFAVEVRLEAYQPAELSTISGFVASVVAGDRGQ